jgi:serine phosphatase RsbU (regulator of sigma subunit)/PAS domain-containing protein
MGPGEGEGIGTVSGEALARVLDQVPGGILIADRSGDVRYANAAALRLLGLPTRLTTPASLAEFAGDLCVAAPDGRVLAPEERPVTRALAGHPFERLDVVMVGADGVKRPVRCSGGPMELGPGQAGAWVQLLDTGSEAAIVDDLREERDLVRALVEHSPLGKAVVRVPEMTLELVNEVFAGLRPELDMTGRQLAAVWPETAAGGWPDLLAGVAATGRTFTVEDAPVDFAGQRRRYFWLSASRLPQPAGRPTRLLLVARETTAEVADRERAEAIAAQRLRDLARSRITSERLKSLVDLSSVMARIEGIDELLHLVTAEAARLLGADSASLFLVDGRGNELVGRACAGLDPDEVIGMRIDPSAWREVAEVLSTGVPVVHERADAVRGPETATIRRFGIRSYLAVLLGTPVRPLGVMFVNHERRVHRFTRAELAFVETVSSYLSVAIERRRLVESLREAVASLQAAMLPESFPEVPGLQIAARYRSASEVAQVGGDFYEVVAMRDGRVAAVIGDVCGKGVAAARHTARLRYGLRTLFGQLPTPGRALAAFNRLVHGEFADDEFVTLALVMVDPRNGSVTWAGAGHPPPLVAGEEPDLRGAESDPPVGLFAAAAYAEHRLHLPVGAGLVLYTDGVIEARDPAGNEFGVDGLAAAVRRGGSADAIAEGLLDKVTDHAGGTLDDDVAVLVLTRVATAP